MTLRIRCQVLAAITAREGCTSAELSEMLPELKPEQIQKAVYQLLSQDKVLKNGKQARSGSEGRPMFLYIVNEDWEPVTADTKPKKGRRDHKESLKVSGSGMAVVRFRDRKIRLLLSLLKHTNGAQRDLMIGILSDFGHKYDNPEPKR